MKADADSAGSDPSSAAGATSFRRFKGSERRFWLLVPVTGLAAGVLTVAFVQLLLAVQSVWSYWGDGSFLDAVVNAPAWLRVTYPIAGGVLVAVFVALVPTDRRLQGSAGIIQALAVRDGIVPLFRSAISGVVSIFAVGMGASLGREGALITVGGGLGSYFGRQVRLEDRHVKILVACGAAGGIAAAYNVPIAASVFAMEVLLLGSFATELFVPIVVSSVLATTVSRAIISGDSTYHVSIATIESSQVLLDLPVAMAVGALLGVVSAGFIRIFSSLDHLLRALNHFESMKPVVAMTVVGLVGLALPELLGNGFDTVNRVLGEDGSKYSIGLLVLLPLSKIVLTALCRGAGIPGGLFTPSLFVGALLGGAIGIGLVDVLPWEPASPQLYALLGMGAILAGTLRAPITAILMVFELTGNYEVILPLMAASIASTLVSSLLQPNSLFTEHLRKRGISIPTTKAPAWIHQPTMQDFVNPEVQAVGAAERFETVRDEFLGTSAEQGRLYVVGEGDRYMGAISLHEIKLFFRESEHLDTVIAADILDPSFPHVYITDRMSRAVEILAHRDAERLPVLDNAKDRRLVGTVSKRDILAVYESREVPRAPTGEGRDEDGD